MADDQKQFQVNITGKDETAGAFSSVEAAFRQLGMTAAQVDAEIKHLQKVDEKDALAQHFRGAEVELRRLGLTSTAVQAEMARLNKMTPAEVEHLSHFDRTMNWLNSRGRKGEGEHEGGEKHGEGHEGGEHEHHGHGWEGINTHINILRTHFGELNENIGETRESLTEMLPMLAGFGAIGSIAGMVELVHATAEEQSQLAAMSKQLGVTADQLQNLHYAAKIADVPITAMDKSIGHLGISMADAASGHNKLDAALFKKMGISLKDAHGHMEPIPKVMEEIAQAMKNTTDPAMRLYVANELMGRSGRDMLPFLIQGREKLEDMQAEAEKLGPALTDLDRDHLEQFNDAWKKAEYVSESFMTKLGADLAPVMTPLLDDFTKFIALNKDWIAADAAKAATDFANAMKQFPWETALKGAEGFAKDVGAIASDINSIVQQIPGGWKTVIEGFAAYKLASPFAHMIGDGMRVLKIGGGLVGIIGKQLPEAFKAADMAWGGFSVAAIAALNSIGAAMSILAAAQKYGDTPIPLNPKQEEIKKGFKLKPGEALTPSQIAAIDAARDKGQPSIQDLWKHDPENSLSAAYDAGSAHPPSDQGPRSPARAALAGIAARNAAMEDHQKAQLPRGPFRRLGTSDDPADGAGAASRGIPGGRDSDSNINLHVQFEGAPPGMTVTTTTSGEVNYSADVGYNQLGGPHR